MSRRTTTLVVLSALVSAALAGWFRPLPQPAASANARAQQWQLPDPAGLERSTAAQFAEIQGIDWSGEGGTTASGGPDTQWKLLGVVGRPEARAILVQAGSDPLIKRFQTGDTLPDGSRLVTVGSSGIVIERDGCQRRRPLYPSAEAGTAGDGCSAPAAD